MIEESERSRRRAQERRRIRRQRVVVLAAVLALIALAGMAVGAFVIGGEASSTAASPPRVVEEAPPSAASEPAPSVTPLSPPSPQAQPTPHVAPPSPHAHVRGKVIVIDPGHNGGNYLHSAEINRQVNAGTLWKACDTTGTQTNGGYTEAAFTFDVSRRVARVLRRAGARVILTRPSNRGWGPCITERAAIGNRAHADVAISIHADGNLSGGRGFHVIYPPSIEGLTDDIAEDSRRLALAIRAAYRATGMPEATYVGTDGLNVRSDLGGLNLSDVPKVLFETGNMRNSVDASLLESASFRERVARAIARGLNAFLRSR